jgi:hypothetical protein
VRTSRLHARPMLFPWIQYFAQAKALKIGQFERITKLRSEIQPIVD